MPANSGGQGGNNDADNVPEDEYERVLRRFVKAHRGLYSRAPVDNQLIAYVAFRNAVLDAAESPGVIGDTSDALRELHLQTGMAETVHLLVMELEAFSASAEMPIPEPTPTAAATRPWWKRLLGIGKTTVDSLLDILEKVLGEKAKAIWKLFSELAEIVGKD